MESLVSRLTSKMSKMTTEERRERLLIEMGGWYNPWVHLLTPSSVGTLVVLGCLAAVERPSVLDWLTVPLTVVGLNLFEWFIHSNVLHEKLWPLGLLNDRHMEHHMVFKEDEMAIKSTKELRLVLMPSIAIFAAFVTSLPIPLLLTLVGLSNAAALFSATTMTYLVSYELLHAAYHAPEGTWLGRSKVIERLRRHHARHHDPTLMQWKNFNVTLPLGDLVFRTTAASRFNQQKDQ